MPKIDPDFQHDVHRFIIRSRRNKLLAKWLGEPGAVTPEKSIQGIFERTQDKIGELPMLLDPAYSGAQLRFLAWLVGWDDSKDVSFIEDLSDDDLRKLIQLSVPLWQEKGSGIGLVNAIRVFTGKTAIVQDWFWHRWIIDESGFWVESRGNDPYLVGGIYTEADEYLTWVILNRQGLTSLERRLVYDLLTYIRVIGEHYALVYAAFVDDFADGFAQWTQLGTPGTFVVNEDDFRGGLDEGAIAKTNFVETELATWSPFQRTIAHIEFATVSAQEVIEVKGMRSADGVTYYAAKLGADGAVDLVSPVGTFSTTITMPVVGTPIGLELRVEPINTAQTKVGVYIGNELQVENTFLGVDAYIDSAGGVTIERSGTEVLTTYVDNVVVLATPHRVQFIGQSAIPPTPGLGGPQYIANPAPELEPFIG